jgi:hypothetical protein
LFKVFLFGDYLCIHWFDCSLVSTFTNYTQVSSLVTRTMWLKNSHQLYSIALKKSKTKPFSAIYAHQWAFSDPILSRTCDSPA